MFVEPREGLRHANFSIGLSHMTRPTDEKGLQRELEPFFLLLNFW